ncbi:MAG: hypothetical protein PUG10_06245 [Lachnospiraceae bacterium]|nr:hypothetical protein [Lachnospiraceae bacterium]
MKSDMFDISPSAFCVEDNIVWGVHAKLNCLFSYDLSTESLEIYDLYPYAIIGRASQFIGIFKYEKNVYLVPCWGSKLISYNIEEKTVIVIEEGNNANGRFGKSFVLGGDLYCVPMYEDFFLIIDLKKGCVKRKIPWKHVISKKIPIIIDSFVFNSKIVCLVKDYSDEVILLDNNFNITRQYIQNNDEFLTTGCSSKENMFLCNPKTGLIFRYDKNFFLQESIKVKSFSHAILNLINNTLILDSVGDPEKSKYFIESKQEKIECSEVKKSPLSYDGMHGLWYCCNRWIYYFDRAKNELYAINEKNIYKTFKIEIKKQIVSDIIKNNIFNEDVMLENDIANLEFLIECVVGENK